MAAQRSPVTIESSPAQEAYRVPSIIPEALRRSTSANSITRSSPQLLSPSAFVRPRAQPLKSGSRAQQVPAGAQAGFATAASIWKEQGQVEHASGTEDKQVGSEKKKDGKGTVERKATGKLSKPKKSSKPSKPSNKAFKDADSPRFDSFVDSRGVAGGVTVKGLGDGTATENNVPSGMDIPRRPSISLSEYSFDAHAVPVPPESAGDEVPAVKKPARKRATKATTGDASASKRARKSKAKSEAIVLDSDEPEVVLDEATLNAKDIDTHAPVAEVPRSKAAKAPASKAKERKPVPRMPETTKEPEPAHQPERESPEKSAYFAEQQPAAHPEPCPPKSSPPLALDEPISHSEISVEESAPVAIHDVSATHSLPPPFEPAPRRRRSWTPAKDSLPENETNTIPAVNYELNQHMGQIPFSEMLGNFSYLQSEAVPVLQRTASGEATTKRRRVELSDVQLPQAKPAEKPKEKPAAKVAKVAKKAKAPKKPQTITALATAAYQPPKEADPTQSTVSAFFAPSKEPEAAPETEKTSNVQVEPAKAKKPRKSRAKVQPAEDGRVAVPKKPAKPRAPKKVKVKCDKADHQPPLYSPTQARKQMNAQDFLFGTSSQLAAEESPEFIREIQLAVRQSEMACALPNGSETGTQQEPDFLVDDKSYFKVPTAPHGTCLSLEQADRELWCVSARDGTGSKLAQLSADRVRDDLPPKVEEKTVQTTEIITLSSSANDIREDQHTHSVPPVARTEHSKVQSVEELPLADKPLAPTVVLEDTKDVQEDTAEGAHDDWMLLQSDDSVVLPQSVAYRSPVKPPATLATSPVRRTALQPLDANIALLASDLASKPGSAAQAQPFSTAARTFDRDRSLNQPSTRHGNDVLAATSPTRGRGRPRKTLSPERVAQTSPARGRGRPRKASLVEQAGASAVSLARGPDSANIGTAVSPKRPIGRPRKHPVPVSTSPERPVGRPRKLSPTSNVVLPSPKRPVGRPRKQSPTNNVALTSPKRPVGQPCKVSVDLTKSPKASDYQKTPQRALAASQPTTRREWTNIDDISDSDTPATPSPRRRRASSSPSFVRPLDFQAQRSPSPKPKAKGSGTAAIKATDANWPAIQAKIFPQIASTIKAAPISEDIKAPSWHEKILLYDPIVLEDLTVWLNGQGLRTEVERLKPKVKTKGRKKKDAPPEVDEWEIVRDELKAWMVQKWCEDHSVCCLWKEGLRGGVKARY